MRQKTKVSVRKRCTPIGSSVGKGAPLLGTLHRNGAQIAQWVGTRTTHPGGTGFETGPPPKPGCESACFPQGLFPPPKTRTWFFGAPKGPFLLKT